MSKAKILVLLLMMLLMLAASPVIASAEGPIAGRGTLTVSKTDYSPPNLGPNVYYGDNVSLVYTITIHWSSITYPNGDVRQTLTAGGTVDVYHMTDPSSPIDTRSCSASLSFYDAGGDACVLTPAGFYDFNWTQSALQNMERLHHLHQVSGVYTRITWVRNGEGGGKVTVFTHPPTIFIVDE